MNNLKLGVHVVSAHDLMPKDGQGSSSAFVELHFDGQKFRTTIKEKDLSPVWDESFYFNIYDPSVLPHLTLDVYVYNHNRATNSRSFLGKVSLSGTSFVPHSDAVVLHYPLEKRGIFSRIKGELGLKFLSPTIQPLSRPLQFLLLKLMKVSIMPRFQNLKSDTPSVIYLTPTILILILNLIPIPILIMISIIIIMDLLR